MSDRDACVQTDGGRQSRQTEHEAAEHEAAEHEAAEHEALLDVFPDAVLFADTDCRCRYVNPAACVLFGVRRERCIGRPIQQIFAEHATLGPAFSACCEARRAPISERVVVLEGKVVEGKADPSVHISIRHYQTTSGGAPTGAVIVARDVSAEHAAAARLGRVAAEEQALTELLELSLSSLPMRQYLDQAVDVLLGAVPWLELLPGGGIFLAEGGALRLVARRRLDPELRRLCAHIQPGECLCGRAAVSKVIEHARCIDSRHTVHFEGMKPHGHYVVPLLQGDVLLGVLALYLPCGRVHDSAEEAFLSRIGDVLAMGIASRQTMEHRIDQLAHYDRLTGLANRELLLARMTEDLSHRPSAGVVGALFHLDIDRFTLVNDALGHAAGDWVLQRVAKDLRRAVDRDVWGPHILARLGGDEFALWLPELKVDAVSDGVARAQRLAWVLSKAVSSRLGVGKGHAVSVGIGVCLADSSADSAARVMTQAGAAVHHAKSLGRSGIMFHKPGLIAKAEERFRLEHELRRAVHREEFVLYYQPQTDGQGRLLGAEALIRWPHARRGLVSPGVFIPVAEDSGLILAIGRWALTQACRRVANCVATFGDAACGVSVNVSALEFHRPEFTDQVAGIVRASKIDPAYITLELTEGIVMQDVERVIEKMHTLRAIGVRLALDDFGTGYSSLSYLKRFPLDELKVDQSFVRGLPESEADAAIVETILAIANRLGLQAIAEGVETEAQRDFLLACGCERYQGFFFSRPLPAEQFVAEWLGPSRS